MTATTILAGMNSTGIVHARLRQWWDAINKSFDYPTLSQRRPPARWCNRLEDASPW